jgi:ribosomal protein L29
MPKNFKEIKNKSVNELKTTLIENQELLRELNFKDANRQLKNVRQIRQIKKMIAQISTVLSQQKDK